MLIILEGCDGSGKSTLAVEIAKQSNGIVIHATYNKNWNVYRYHEELYNHALQLEKICGTVVMDRFCISEYVYGTIYRDGPSYDVFAAQKDVTATWVFCTNENVGSNHETNKKKRYEMFTDKMDEVNGLFSKVVLRQVRDGVVDWKIYDYDKVSKEEFTKELLNDRRQ